MKIVSDLSLTGRPIRRASMAPRLVLDFTTGALPDRVSFTRAGSATYFDAAGVLRTALADVPRFDHDPVTLQPRGLLIEGACTNLVLQSGDLAAAVWAKQNANVAADAVPFGVLTAYRITETAVSGTHGVGQSVTVASGVGHTISTFAKADQRKLLRIGCSILGIYAVFDLDAGVVQHVDAGVTARMMPVGGGYYRCSVTITPAGTAANILLRMQSAPSEWPGSGIYTGDGLSGLFATGVQVEAKTFASSYIPTTTAASTRAADRAEVGPSNTSAWLNKSEGTFGIDFTGFGEGSNCGVLFVQKKSSGPRYQISYGPTGLIGGAVVNDDSVVTHGGLSFGAAVPHGTEVRAAMAYKVGDVAGTRNGAVPTVGAPASIPLTIDTVLIGEANNERLFGHIRRLRYWPTRLANARLQELTA